jgi:cytochrome c-type biogenesis protein CcmF
LLSREAVFLLQNLVLVAMVFVVFWITFFPLISEAITGTKVSVGPPAFRPFIVPLALVLVALAGIGPVIAWRRVTAANLRRNFTVPVGVGATTAAVLLAAGDGSKPFALAMFALGAFVLATVAQELWRGAGARRAMTREPPPVALLRLIRRNRRRYGGYIVHAGLAVLLIGVAASSSFQHSRDVVLRPGQKVTLAGYTFRYVRPTAAATSQKLSFGAVLAVSRGGKPVTTLRTTRGFYPSQDPALGVIGRFFNGEADSNVGLQAGLTRDLWTVVNPDLSPLQSYISKGDRLFAAALPAAMQRASRLPAGAAQSALGTLWQYRDRAIVGIAARFVSHPWPINFLLIVDPLVLWIWIGAIIIASGGLIALWPIPRLERGRVRFRARARSGAAAPPVTPAREPA